MTDQPTTQPTDEDCEALVSRLTAAMAILVEGGIRQDTAAELAVNFEVAHRAGAARRDPIAMARHFIAIRKAVGR